jgi:hypothetical protein
MAKVRSIDSGRKVHLTKEVEVWLTTGVGFVHGAGKTRGGSTVRNAEDLRRALAAHMTAERADQRHNSRHGMETKFETRDYTVDDGGERQHFWLWLNTNVYNPNHAKGVIIVGVDHG